MTSSIWITHDCNGKSQYELLDNLGTFFYTYSALQRISQNKNYKSQLSKTEEEHIVSQFVVTYMT